MKKGTSAGTKTNQVKWDCAQIATRWPYMEHFQNKPLYHTPGVGLVRLFLSALGKKEHFSANYPKQISH